MKVAITYHEDFGRNGFSVLKERIRPSFEALLESGLVDGVDVRKDPEEVRERIERRLGRREHLEIEALEERTRAERGPREGVVDPVEHAVGGQPIHRVLIGELERPNLQIWRHDHPLCLPSLEHNPLLD